MSISFEELDRLMGQIKSRPWFRWTGDGDISSEPDDCMIMRSMRAGRDKQMTDEGRQEVNAVIALVNSYDEIRKRIAMMDQALERASYRSGIVDSVREMIDKTRSYCSSPLPGFGDRETRSAKEVVDDMMTWPSHDLPAMVHGLTHYIATTVFAEMPVFFRDIQNRFQGTNIGTKFVAIAAYVLFVEGGRNDLGLTRLDVDQLRLITSEYIKVLTLVS